DSLALARIDSGSFSEKDILAKTTFDMRPSTANEQKRRFKQSVDEFAAGLSKGSPHTDITGGVMQATQYLQETGAGDKFILIFSDMEEDFTMITLESFQFGWMTLTWLLSMSLSYAAITWTRGTIGNACSTGNSVCRMAVATGEWSMIWRNWTACWCPEPL